MTIENSELGLKRDRIGEDCRDHTEPASPGAGGVGYWGSCSASHTLATSWAELEVKIANHNPIMLLWGKGTNPVSPTKQIIKMSSLGAGAARQSTVIMRFKAPGAFVLMLPKIAIMAGGRVARGKVDLIIS